MAKLQLAAGHVHSTLALSGRGGAEERRRPGRSRAGLAALALALLAVPASAGTAGPDDTRALYDRGRAEAVAGDLGRAIADLSEAIRRDPTPALAYAERGRAHLDRGELEVAIADFDAAIRLDPDYAFAYSGRGIAYERTGRKEQARREFERALALDPHYQVPRDHLAGLDAGGSGLSARPATAVKAAAGGPAAASPAGPASIPGARLEFADVELTRLTAGMEVLYHLHATGLLADRSYRLELRRVDGSVVRMPLGSVHYDASGVLVSRLGPLDAQPLSYGPVFKGEPLTQALVAEDGSGQVVAKLVPVPIEAEGAGGCAARLELLDGTGQVFMLSARGFRPGEEVRMVSRSEGETLTSAPKASPAGEVTIVLAPAVVGKTGGSASISLAGRACTVTVPYRWGTAMERA